MRRAAIVLTATGAGLAAVLGFHPSRTTAAAASSGTAAAATSVTPSSTPSSTPSASATAGTSGTVLGSQEGIAGGQYGELQVKVTITNGRITAVDMAALSVNDPRSQQIEQVALPLLEQQTVSAQGASIQGVSGATYTTQAYETSLQAALDQLG